MSAIPFGTLGGVIHAFRAAPGEQPPPCSIKIEGLLAFGDDDIQPPISMWVEKGNIVSLQVNLAGYVLVPRTAFERIGLDLVKLFDRGEAGCLQQGRHLSADDDAPPVEDS